jgi:hypothetical protein
METVRSAFPGGKPPRKARPPETGPGLGPDSRPTAHPLEQFVQSCQREYTHDHNMSIGKYDINHYFFPVEGSP